MRIEIKKIASEGYGIGYENGKVVFVPFTMPGDEVQVRIEKRKKRYNYAVVDTLIKPSPQRILPLCEHFTHCGGCKWQHIPYELQLQYKRQRVIDALERIAGLKSIEVQPIIGAPQLWYYRNKIDFSFGFFKGEPSLGFHPVQQWHTVLKIHHCFLVPPYVDTLRRLVLRWALRKNIPFYNPKTHEGNLRSLVIRIGHFTKQLMVILITKENQPTLAYELYSYLQKHFPYPITSFIHIHNPKRNDAYNDLSYQVIAGNDHIEERLGKCVFKISPTAFFQTNSLAAWQLYEVVKRFVPQNSDFLLDAYCGTGSIGLYVAEKVKKVLGIEVNASAVEDAKQNAKRNQIQNAWFIVGDLQKMHLDAYRPSIVIVDPPRGGLSKKMVQWLKKSALPLWIYVSCNPATQARDVGQLKTKYKVVYTQPVDLFPHTPHVENVMVLQHR